MKVTIKDIAKETGVSISTVSLVLNNKPSRVSAATKERILETAERLNYIPNLAAKSLVTKESKTIGMIIPDIENAFFSSMSKAVEDYFRNLGYMVLIMNSNDLHHISIENIKLLRSREIDGLLFVLANESYQKSKQKEISDLLTSLKLPIVMIDRVFNSLMHDKVYFNNKLGGYLATKHLIEHGHQKIACITGPKGTKSSDERLKGFLLAMEESNLEVCHEVILEGDYHFNSGYKQMKKLLNKDISAIFAFNDLMAFGAIRTITEANKKVPDDFSLVGYDHFALSDLINAQLDSVKQDSKIIGYEASKILNEKMISKTTEIKEICLEPTLTIKGSVNKLTK